MTRRPHHRAADLGAVLQRASFHPSPASTADGPWYGGGSGPTIGTRYATARSGVPAKLRLRAPPRDASPLSSKRTLVAANRDRAGTATIFLKGAKWSASHLVHVDPAVFDIRGEHAQRVPLILANDEALVDDGLPALV